LALGRELQSALAPSIAGPLPPDVIPQPAATRSSNWIKWVVAGLAVTLVFVIVGGTITAYLLKTRVSNNANSSESPSETVSQNRNTTAVASTAATKHDLRGTWTGTYGPLSNPAKLIIKNQKEKRFDGILQQGEFTVRFAGNYDANSLELSFQELEVLAGSGWSLGEDTGKLSADGTKMSGTGKDAIGGQFGISYQWSFARQ